MSFVCESPSCEYYSRAMQVCRVPESTAQSDNTISVIIIAAILIYDRLSVVSYAA